MLLLSLNTRSPYLFTNEFSSSIVSIFTHQTCTSSMRRRIYPFSVIECSEPRCRHFTPSRFAWRLYSSSEHVIIWYDGLIAKYASSQGFSSDIHKDVLRITYSIAILLLYKKSLHFERTCKENREFFTRYSWIGRQPITLLWRNTISIGLISQKSPSGIFSFKLATA